MVFTDTEILDWIFKHLTIATCSGGNEFTVVLSSGCGCCEDYKVIEKVGNPREAYSKVMESLR
jgi:hypothetical protein